MPAQRARSWTVAGPWPRKNRRASSPSASSPREPPGCADPLVEQHEQLLAGRRSGRGTACRSAPGTRAGGSRAGPVVATPPASIAASRSARRSRPPPASAAVTISRARSASASVSPSWPQRARPARRAPGGRAGRASRAGRRRRARAGCRASATSGRARRRPARPRRPCRRRSAVRRATDGERTREVLPLHGAPAAAPRRPAVAAPGPASHWAASRSRPTSAGDVMRSPWQRGPTSADIRRNSSVRGLEAARRGVPPGTHDPRRHLMRTSLSGPASRDAPAAGVHARDRRRGAGR